jgi:hypothetical protein
MGTQNARATFFNDLVTDCIRLKLTRGQRRRRVAIVELNPERSTSLSGAPFTLTRMDYVVSSSLGALAL